MAAHPIPERKRGIRTLAPLPADPKPSTLETARRRGPRIDELHVETPAPSKLDFPPLSVKREMRRKLNWLQMMKVAKTSSGIVPPGSCWRTESVDTPMTGPSSPEFESIFISKLSSAEYKNLPKAIIDESLKYVSSKEESWKSVMYSLRVLLKDGPSRVKSCLPPANLKGNVFERVVSGRQLSQSPHDFLILALSNGFDSDKPLRTLLPRGGSQRTPDFLGEEEGYVWVGEVKTAASSSAAFAQGLRIDTLQDEVSRVASVNGKPVVFSSFLLTPEGFRGPVGLSSVEMDTIKQCHQLGHAIQSLSNAQSLINLDEESTESKVLFDKLLGEIELVDHNKSIPSKASAHGRPLITHEMISYWDSIDESKIRSRLVANAASILKESIVLTRKKYEPPDLKQLDADISEFMKRTEQEKESRIDRKAVVQLPLFVPNFNIGEYKDFKQSPICPSDHDDESAAMMRLWSKALSKRDSITDAKPELFAQMDPKRKLLVSEMNADEYYAERLGRHELADKRKMFKVDVRPPKDDPDSAVLAKMGVWSKRFMKSPPEGKDPIGDGVRLKHSISKKPFSMSVNTSDIDAFVNGGGLSDLMKRGEGGHWDSKRLEHLKKLGSPWQPFIKENERLSPWSFFDSISSTPFGRALQCLSRVIEEFIISLTNFCPGGNVIIKRVPGTPITMLIKTSSPSKSSSFSLLIPKGAGTPLGLPFKAWHEFENCWISSFVTSDRMSATNLMYTDLKFVCAVAHFTERLGLDIESVINSPNWNQDLVSHVAALMLSHLEDKNQTGVALQQIRYFYMESISGGGKINVRPMKMLKKLDERPRSRLMVWVYKQIISCFKTLTIMQPVPIIKPKEAEGDLKENEVPTVDSRDNWFNLISWVTLKPVAHFSVALDVSYYHTWHNNEKGGELQGFFKIFNKVIGEELKYRKTNPEHIGYSDVKFEDLGEHEFSPHHIMDGANKVKQFIKRQNGLPDDDTYWHYMKGKIREELRAMMSDTVATLKAQALITDQDLKFVEMSDFKKKYNRRRKVASGVRALFDEVRDLHVNLLYDMVKLLDMLESGGLLVNLFKKLQHGGPREIFVLNMLGRLNILFIERLARAFCREMPSEMMTKRDGKKLMNSQHFAKVRKSTSRDEESCTVTQSDDASAWCQKFVMPAFGAFWKNLLPRPLFLMVCRILNMVAKKKLELPYKMMAEWANPEKASIESTTEEMREAKRQWLTEEGPHDICDYQSAFLKNYTNMMQGIIHYGAGLLHVGHLMTMEEINENIIKSFCKQLLLKPPKYIPTVKVSSDDSSVLRTLIYSKKPDPLYKEWSPENATFLLIILCMCKQVSYPLITARQSLEKSTNPVIVPCEEFNSEWWLNGDEICPLLKFTYASCSGKVSASVIGRQQIQADLRKQVVENGGSNWLASVIQACHFNIHYRCFGSRSDPLLFELFESRLRNAPHPACGLFALEPSITCGLTGFDYPSYLLVKHSEKSRKVEHYIMQREGVAVDDLGRPSIVAHMYFGNDGRFKTFVDDLTKKDKDWREWVEGKKDGTPGDPSIMVRPASRPKEAFFKIYKKCSSPGSAVAFSFQTDSRMLASSVYVLWTPSISVRSSTKVKTEVEKESLLKFTKRLGESIKSEELDQVSTDTFLRFMYPQSLFYDQLSELSAQYGTSTPVRLSAKPRKRLMKLTITKRSTMTDIPLVDCIRHSWFGIKTRYSEKAISLGWIAYKSIFKWLEKSSLEATTKNPGCPFKEVIPLMDFVSQQRMEERSIKMLAPGRKDLPSVALLSQSMKYNSYPGYKLVPREKIKMSSGVLERLNSQLVQLVSAPFLHQHSCTEAIRKLLSESKLELPASSEGLRDQFAQWNEREGALAVMVMSCKKELSNRMTEAIRVVKRGVWGAYSLRQEASRTPTETRWIGPGTFEFQIDECRGRVQLLDETVIRIEVSDLSNFYKCTEQFDRLMREVKINLNTGRREVFIPPENHLTLQPAAGYSASRVSLEAASLHTIPVYISKISEPMTVPDTVEVIERNGFLVLQAFSGHESSVLSPFDSSYTSSHILLKNELVVTLLQFAPSGSVDVGYQPLHTLPGSVAELTSCLKDAGEDWASLWVSNESTPIVTLNKSLTNLARSIKASSTDSMRDRLGRLKLSLASKLKAYVEMKYTTVDVTRMETEKVRSKLDVDLENSLERQAAFMSESTAKYRVPAAPKGTKGFDFSAGLTLMQKLGEGKEEARGWAEESDEMLDQMDYSVSAFRFGIEDPDITARMKPMAARMEAHHPFWRTACTEMGKLVDVRLFVLGEHKHPFVPSATQDVSGLITRVAWLLDMDKRRERSMTAEEEEDLSLFGTETTKALEVQSVRLSQLSPLEVMVGDLMNTAGIMDELGKAEQL